MKIVQPKCVALLSRRAFLGLMGRLGACALAPTHILERAVPDSGYSYWRQVLAKGVSFIPAIMQNDLSGWSKEQIVDQMLATVDYAIKRNAKVQKGATTKTNETMREVVNFNKRGQFLQENIPGRYSLSSSYPEVTCEQDPTRARIFYDLAGFILDEVRHAINSSPVYRLTDFDTKLLRSAGSYLRSGIAINRRFSYLAPEGSKGDIQANIGAGYNNLGLALSFQGKLEEAKRMYQKALQLKPNDPDILQNLKSLEANGKYR